MNFNLLEAASNADAAGGSGSILLLVGYIVFFVAIFYFIAIRPQRKKQKEEKQMRENLQVGDEIITIGGIHGRVISLKEDTMVIESLSDHSKLTFSRWALQSNQTIHDDTPAKK